SYSFRGSSVESDSTMHSPVGLQYQNHAWNDVFPEPTDCHAARCPIHQRYDPSQHLMRFFSDGTPPPVPKKRLARTLSLPDTDPPPLSPSFPLSPGERHNQNFDNPLYMLAPIPDIYFHEEINDFEPGRESPVPLPSLSQLSFDTPDEHLPYHFSSFDDQSVVFQRIQHRHLLCLRSVAQSVEAGILLQGEATERGASSYQPQDFLLCEGSEPKQIGDMVYYSLRSPKLPGRVLGLRVHKHTDGASSSRQPLHVNVKDVIVHFHPSNAPRSDSSPLQTQDLSRLFQSDCSAAKPPGAGSTERATDCTNTILPAVQSFLQRGHSVSVERDLPHVTLEDFVQESRLPSTDCLDYDRQVCVLLLQILMGSQHLYNVSSSAAELKPQEIFLVWPRVEMGWEKTEKKGKTQMLWKTHGSPRVLLTPLSPAVSVPHLLTSIKSQIGALIQYCLDSQESPTSKSLYRRGLLYLASLLQSESGGPQMADTVATLKVLIWGPRIPLFNHRAPGTTAVQNWLTIKRALLVIKLAERGLVQDQSALNWEDCMCLQYLSFTDHETVVSVSSQLWLTLNVD
ncbi:hypothetical protein L3Q82_025845, partial [Scortum barcoo]